MWSWLSSFFTSPSPPPPKPKDDLPPAKVAIIGAGIGGCFAAKFLRENGGEKLDIHVFAKKGSKIGGRAAVCQFKGHLFETGVLVIHSQNKYLVDTAKQHDLTTKKESIPVPCGFYNGKSLFRIGRNKIVQFVQMLWRYGFDFIRLVYFVSGFVWKWNRIYSLQENGMAYANVEDLLKAMGGRRMRNLMKVSAYDYMRNDLRLNETLVDEFVRAPIQLYYGQNTSVNAFVGMLSVGFNGMTDNLWRVVGGNHQIAECALRDSCSSSLVMKDVVSVTKTEEDSSVKYTIITADGKADEGYDVVIVANPLNTSSIKYDNFSNDVYTAAATTPYQRFIATFCKGKINQQFFGENANLKNFPQAIITTNVASLPFNFGGIGAVVPSDVQQDEVWKYRVPLHEDPVRVWEVASPQPLTRDQFLSLFPETDPTDTACYDWLAFPQHIPPYQAPSFILEDGVFYINAIEMAASTMEMTAIGAKNAALLARDYLMQHKL